MSRALNEMMPESSSRPWLVIGPSQQTRHIVPAQRHYQKQNLATVYYQIYRIYGQNKSQHHKESSGSSSASGTVGIVLVLPMKHPSAEQTDDIIIRSVIMMMDPPHSTMELSTRLREGLHRSLKPPLSNDLCVPIL